MHALDSKFPFPQSENYTTAMTQVGTAPAGCPAEKAPQLEISS
jgi:hypothetical protein